MCGLRAEARALGALSGDQRLTIGISGARPDRATLLAREMAGSGVDVLVSWGIAGGLDPALPSGTLILPGAVAGPDGEQIGLAGPSVGTENAGLIAGSDAVASTPDAKAAIRAATGAVAVDMETHRVARAARDAGIPCIAIRAISDPADRALPPGTEDAVDAAGNPRILPVIAGLIRRPASLRALLAAKRDFDSALAALSAEGVDVLRGVIDGSG